MQEESKKMNGMAATVAVIALVIGLGVGAGITKAMDNGDTKDSSSMAQKADTSTAMDSASDGVTVGGAKMVQDKDIVDNAVNAKIVTTVVAAVKAAGLVDTLKSEGPFTVFAPNNAAFDALPAGTVDTLLKPENIDTLKKILTYHVVAGTYTTADLKVMASKGETLTTVEGEMLTPVMVDNKVQLQDAKGSKITIETPNVISSNGVTHVVTAVMMPAN
jgi:uncharacterized surface protein with fasciclin (FAS1) repeats